MLLLLLLLLLLLRMLLPRSLCRTLSLPCACALAVRAHDARRSKPVRKYGMATRAEVDARIRQAAAAK